MSKTSNKGPSKKSSNTQRAKQTAPLRARKSTPQKCPHPGCKHVAGNKGALTRHLRSKHVRKCRAVDYDKDISLEILKIIEDEGVSLRTALRRESYFPSRRTFYRWRQQNEGLELEYQLVTIARDDDDFEEIEEIARETTDENYNRNRLVIDTRKWSLGKRRPDVYGTKFIKNDSTLAGELSHNHKYEDMSDDELLSRAKELASLLRGKS